MTKLLNITGLSHPRRHAFWIKHPPAVISALDECTCWPYGDPSRATTSIAKQRYCWIMWKHGHAGPTVFRWLSTKDHRCDRPAGILSQLTF